MSRTPRILSVVGTRPEAIKMAPVIRALARRGGCVHRLVLTGQHTTMVDQVLDRFRLEADYDLALMKPGQTLYDVGHACMDGLSEVARDFSPDVTVVQGDTATVFFAGLVTFFERGRLAHVEAGLRSRRKWSPFPEEMLRRMTDTVSDFCFAPTPAAAANLAAEGVEPERIFVTGNTVVDALQEVREHPPEVEDAHVARLLGAGGPVVATPLGSGEAPPLGSGASTPSGSAESAPRTPSGAPRQLALLTAHRRESFGAPLEGVFEAVGELVDRFPEVEIIYPVHPNPQVKGPARRILAGRPRVHMVDPLAYGDLLAVLRRASLVLTDSGGIQEEAPAFGVHTLVLREVTERPEAVQAGAATLVGTDRGRIVAEATARLSAQGAGPAIPNPYGDGRAGERIADILLSALTGAPRDTTDWTPP